MVTNYFHRSKKNATIGEIKQFQIFIKFIRKIVNGNRAIDRKGNCRAPPSWSPEASRAGRISPSIHPSSIPCARGVEQAVPGPGWGIFGAGRVTRPAIPSRDPLRSAATNARPRPSRPSVRPPAAASRRRHPHPRHPLAPRTPVPSRRAPFAMTRRAAGCRRVSCLPAAMASWRGSRRPR